MFFIVLILDEGEILIESKHSLVEDICKGNDDVSKEAKPSRGPDNPGSNTKTFQSILRAVVEKENRCAGSNEQHDSAHVHAQGLSLSAEVHKSNIGSFQSPKTFKSLFQCAQ